MVTGFGGLGLALRRCRKQACYRPIFAQRTASVLSMRRIRSGHAVVLCASARDFLDRIASHSNATIKRIRSLRDKSLALEGRFLSPKGLSSLKHLKPAAVPEILVLAEGAHRHPLVEALIGAVEASGGQSTCSPRDILHKIYREG